MKQFKIDLDKTFQYQANGRLKAADKKEFAHLKIKKYICPNCNNEITKENKEFGEIVNCPKCNNVMIIQY